MCNWHRKIKIMVIIFIVTLIAISTSVAFVNAAPPQKIKIGVIGPMKFQSGKHSWWGAEMAVDEINAAGGITVGGKKYNLELVKADSNEQMSTSDAVTAMGRLITVNNVNFVIGGYLTEPVLAMQDVAADHKVIFIGGAGAPEICGRLAKNYDRYKYYFRALHPNSAILGKLNMIVMEVGAAKIRKELGIMKPKVALLLTKTKVTDAIADSISATLPKLGMELVGVWRTSPTAPDYTTELTAIRASGAQIIGTFLWGPTGVVFSRQWGELRIPAIPIGFNVDACEKAYWERTGGMCEYETLYSTFGRVSTTEKSIPFWDNYVKKTKEYPSSQSGTYASVYIIKEAIERAGTFETEAVVLALENTDYTGPSGRYRFFPRDHMWPHDLVFGPNDFIGIGTQWRNGELVIIWPNGEPALGDESWKGVRFKETKELELPPWMIKFWKDKAAKN